MGADLWLADYHATTDPEERVQMRELRRKKSVVAGGVRARCCARVIPREDKFVLDCMHLSKELFDWYMWERLGAALTVDLRSALLLAYRGGPT